MEDTHRAPGAALLPTGSTSNGSGWDAAARLLDAALRCAEGWHWDAFPGTWLNDANGSPQCSCGDRACAAFGAHHAAPPWPGLATGGAVIIRLPARRPLA